MRPQVTFRGLDPSADVVETVRRKALKLTEITPELHGCHVVIEASPRGHTRPQSYRVSLHLSGGAEAQRRLPRHVSHENLRVALRDVFRAAHRLLTTRAAA
ncbi:MAG: HPF/RaiA family ribosome-associated protein [Polyangiales bacterium]